MSALAMMGIVTLSLSEKRFRQLLLPLVALAAGSLLGGALFHLIPLSIEELGNGLFPYLLLSAGFVTFLALEQFLHWHHCHRPTSQHTHPVGQLILVADTLHNFLGGIAVASAFIVDTRLGITTWLVMAAHEVPQELGDFGILVHSGWSVKKALAYNFLSGLSFLLGGLVTYSLSARVNVALWVPFTAGNFLYVACADLLPEVSRHEKGLRNVVHFAAFLVGLLLVLSARLFEG